jgi:hypothetical protein
MLAWIIQITIISFIFIFLIDHLIKFFTNTLTVPKLKDLVNNPNKKYDSIYEILSKKNDSTDIFNLPIHSSLDNNSNSNSNENMKNELKNFLKNQLNLNNIEEKEKEKEKEYDYSNLEYFQFK